MNKQVSVLFMLCGILFNVAILISNILAFKIISIGGITATAGLIIFPVSYILNDCITEVWGFKKARFIVWTGFATNFLTVILYQISIVIPPAPFWGFQEAYTTVLSQTPRIAIACLCAFLTGSFLNAYIMSRMKTASNGKRFSVRAIVSTLIGESADSMIFFTIAFAGIFPASEIGWLIFTQTFMKSGYEVIILPVTTRVVNYIKRMEGVDVYDREISYNVLKINEI
ncbi:MAG: queuosine precursor transporter [Candidatus Azobacteroides sp.]|nr:queuosine precursor transporter [Candidatus Azobacteroides sp.]